MKRFAQILLRRELLGCVIGCTCVFVTYEISETYGALVIALLVFAGLPLARKYGN